MKRLNKIAVMICLVAMVGLMSSCSKENQDDSLSGVVTIKVTSPAMSSTKATEPGTEQENKIENLKIFVLVGTNTTIEKLYDFDPSQDHIFDADTRWNAAKQSMEMGEFTNPDKMRAIYTVANWYPVNIDDYKVGKLSGELFKQITTNIGESASPFVMSGYQSAQFDTHSRYEIKLVRQPIKVEMTVVLDAAFAAAYPDFVFGKLDEQATPTMGVLSTPNMSRVYNTVSIKDETGFGYVNIVPKEVEQFGSGNTKLWKVQFYLYENPTDGIDGADATKFVFRLPYQKTAGNAQTDNYYTIALKTSDVTAPHKTVRNTIYRVKATLLGFGSTTPTDFDNTVSTSVKVVPWDDEAYNDQIGGAKLRVNLSSINIRGSIVNTQLVVESDDLGSVTFTDVSDRLTTPTIDTTTGVVSIKTKTAIGLYAANYATFKVNRGGFSKTITVNAGLWAKGNIIWQNTNGGEYINSTNPLEDGLCFFPGANVGLKYLPPHKTPWTVNSKYYLPISGAIEEKTGISTWNDAKLKSTGDPCALIKPVGDWRLPNKAEFDDLATNLNSWNNTTKSTVFYNNTLNLKWAGAGVRGEMYEHELVGLYWTKEGNVLSKIELFSVRTEIFFKYRAEDFDAFTVRCVHK